MEIIGKNLNKLNNETGGHRIQRVPPTEKRGRIHTSTVTVAVFDINANADTIYDLRDDNHFYIEWFSGTGNGGQHRNKHQNSCRLYHLPTGLVESRQGKSRTRNLTNAKEALLKLLDKNKEKQYSSSISKTVKDQIGSGMRGDKIRTYRFQEDIIIDHKTNKKYNLKQIMRGNFNKIWN